MAVEGDHPMPFKTHHVTARDVAERREQEIDVRIAQRRALIARLEPTGRAHLLTEARRILVTLEILREQAAARAAELERNLRAPDR